MQLGEFSVSPGAQVPTGHVYVEGDIPFAAPIVVMVIRYAYRERSLFTVIDVRITLTVIRRFQSFRFLCKQFAVKVVYMLALI